MRPILPAVLATAAFLATVASPSQSLSLARGEVPLPVVAADPVGDVKILPHHQGLTRRELRSVDVRQVQVERLGTEVRFTVWLREVTRPARMRFNQSVFMRVEPTGTNAHWFMDVGMSPQQNSIGYAYLYLDDQGTRYRQCDPLVSQASLGKNYVRIDVPRRCAPYSTATVKGVAITGFFRSDAYAASRDKFHLPDAIDFG